MEARRLALDDADAAVQQWFGSRLDSRRPKPPPQPEAPPPAEDGVDLDSLASLLGDSQ